MPIIKSAVKRMKQTATRRARNVGIKRDVKTAVKAFLAQPSADTLSKAQSEIDKSLKKGLIKKNTAARRKANLAKTAKEAGVKLATSSKKTTEKKAPVKKTEAKTAEKKSPAKKPAAKKSTAKKDEK